VYKGMFMNF